MAETVTSVSGGHRGTHAGSTSCRIIAVRQARNRPLNTSYRAEQTQPRGPLIFRICELPHKAEALSGLNFSPACIVMTMPFCRKVPRMRHLLRRAMLAIAGATIINPVQAQIAPQIAAVPQWPPAAN